MSELASNPELAEAFSAYDQYTNQLSRQIIEAAQLFGIQGISVNPTPFQGWSSVLRPNGEIQFNYDPLGFHEGEAVETMHRSVDEEGVLAMADFLKEATDSDKWMVSMVTCHELGHIRHFLEAPDKIMSQSDDPADKFFLSEIDEILVDAPLMILPGIDQAMTERYRPEDGDNFLEYPLHAQLMAALRARAVTGVEIEVVEQVQQELDNLFDRNSSNGIVDIIATMTGSQTGYEQAHEIAEVFIKPAFIRFYEEDIRNGFISRSDELEGVDFGFGCGHGIDHETAGPELSMAHAFATLKDQVAQQSQNGKKGSGEGAGQSLSELLELSEIETEAYLDVLRRRKRQIAATSDALMLLGSPSPHLVQPNYSLRPRREGRRLHPRMLHRARIQQTTGIEQPIWQEVTQREKKTDPRLRDLDIHLISDVSGSMEGISAKIASEGSLVVGEAVELTRERLRRDVNHEIPDVRFQIMIFGSGNTIVSPLRHSTSPAERGQTFSTLRKPNGGTSVEPSLKKIYESVRGADRFQLIFILSDGWYHDTVQARSILGKFNPNKTHVVELLTRTPVESRIIGQHAQHITDSDQVPFAIQAQTTSFVDRINSSAA